MTARAPVTALLTSLVLAAGCGPAEHPVVLATTTSVDDSGLLGHVLREYSRDEPEVAVRPLAVGSGEALELGRRGDADLLIVHHPSEEEKFVASGRGEGRVPLMYNDFVFVGPPSDPAKVAAADGASEVMRAITSARASFLSRGDRSGTHGKELELWSAAAVTPAPPWYREAGQGMGMLLQMASEKGAYALSDRATFRTMEAHLNLEILYAGGPELENVYSAILVTDSRAVASARTLLGWLTSERGQRAIEEYRDALGRDLFQPIQAAEWARPAVWDGSGSVYPAPDVVGEDSVPQEGVWETLRKRLLCRSTPPEQADPSCR